MESFTSLMRHMVPPATYLYRPLGSITDLSLNGFDAARCWMTGVLSVVLSHIAYTYRDNSVGLASKSMYSSFTIILSSLILWNSYVAGRVLSFVSI